MVSVYGYFVAEALLLGVGPEPHALVHKLVGLLLAAMIIMFVPQNRLAVRRWIAGAEPDAPGTWGRARVSLAVIWHVLAIAYTVAVYSVWAVELEGGFDYLVRGTVVTLLAVAIAAITGLQRAIERGIEIPFPHQTVYLGTDRTGQAPATRIALENAAPAQFDVDRAEQREEPSKDAPAAGAGQSGPPRGSG